MKPSQETRLNAGKVGQRCRRESRRQEGKAGRSSSHVREHLTGAGEREAPARRSPGEPGTAPAGHPRQGSCGGDRPRPAQRRAHAPAGR